MILSALQTLPASGAPRDTPCSEGTRKRNGLPRHRPKPEARRRQAGLPQARALPCVAGLEVVPSEHSTTAAAVRERIKMTETLELPGPVHADPPEPPARHLGSPFFADL